MEHQFKEISKQHEQQIRENNNARARKTQSKFQTNF
jgi:hypothetical protein